MLTEHDALAQELARIILQWDRNREVMNVRPDAKARWIAQQASVLSQPIRTTDAARIAALEEIVGLLADFDARNSIVHLREMARATLRSKTNGAD